MSIFDAVRSFLVPEPYVPLQMRTTVATPLDDYPSLATQLQNIRRASPGPYRTATIREAMGVPAIFGAVNLIANTTGSMSMRALRNEVELPPEQRPRLIVRPDPFKIPRRFYGPTAYNIASRGEAWWWVAARDRDRNALSLINISPREVLVEDNPRDARYPWITWRNRTTKRPVPTGFVGADFDDFRQLVYADDPDFPFRGVGPLQMCGAAISVAVESQLWAANFFAGGNSALWVKTSVPLSGGDEDSDGQAEVDRFLTQWMNKDSNTPRITDDTIEDIKELNLNPQGAQMLESRAHQNIEVATMFNMDAELLNAAVAGSSLTYQNIGGRFDGFIRQCLQPNYLETIEETISDLLTRSTVARFNTDSLKLADIKTRYEVYGLGIDKGIIDSEEARKFEGLAPGDVENAPVPMSPPQAIPAASELQMRSAEVRCDGMRTFRRSGVTSLRQCNALLAPAGESFVGRCRKCKKAYAAA